MVYSLEETVSIISYLNLETKCSFPGPPDSTKSSSVQCISHLCPFGIFFSLEGYGLSSWTDITHQSSPLVLKARLTSVAAATSQLNPHVYLEKCQSSCSLTSQTPTSWLMATFTSCSKSINWATFFLERQLGQQWQTQDCLSLWEPGYPEPKHWEGVLFYVCRHLTWSLTEKEKLVGVITVWLRLLLKSPVI